MNLKFIFCLDWPNDPGFIYFHKLILNINKYIRPLSEVHKFNKTWLMPNSEIISCVNQHAALLEICKSHALSPLIAL